MDKEADLSADLQKDSSITGAQTFTQKRTDDPISDTQEISLFEDENEVANPTEGLSERAILAGSIDPLIGLTAQDFAIFK